MPDPNPPQYPIQPSNPLSALRKATSIGADQPPITLGQMPLGPGGPLSGLKGAVEEAGQAAQQVPLVLHPSVRALLEMLSTDTGEMNPLKALAQEKTGGKVPFRQMIQVPKGMELPPETSPWIARDPALVDRFVQEQNALQYEPPLKQAPQFPSPSQPRGVGSRTIIPGFASKFEGANKYNMGR